MFIFMLFKGFRKGPFTKTIKIGVEHQFFYFLYAWGITILKFCKRFYLYAFDSRFSVILFIFLLIIFSIF